MLECYKTQTVTVTETGRTAEKMTISMCAGTCPGKNLLRTESQHFQV